MTYVDVVFPISVREAFTYAVPEPLEPLCTPGVRVFVPFQQHRRIGMAVRVHHDEPAFKVKPVEAVIDEQPVLGPELLKLASWISRYYFCGMGEAIQAMMPVGMQVDAVMWLQPTPAAQTAEGPKWEAARAAFDKSPKLKRSFLISAAGVTENWINTQVKAGLLERVFIPENRMKAPVYEHLVATQHFTDDGILEAVRTKKKLPAWARQAFDLRVMDILPAPASEVRAAGFDGETIKRLLELEFLKTVPYEPSFQLHADYQLRLNPLNEEQSHAASKLVHALSTGNFHAFLLKGVTGSGKTEVYLHALAETLKQGRDGLILVPEIALTPQTVRRFKRVFGDAIAVLHSRLSDRERLDEWEHIRNGRKRIVIGARSAVFAPLKNLGLIIIDEEHDTSFKQADPAPRYHARETALLRASLCGSVVVCGSATPSLNSLNAVERGKMTLLTLSGRHGRATLPPVQILDLKFYKRSGMHGPLAAPLFLAAEEALGVGDQVIFLHNRRGYAHFLQCEACGSIPECPHCSVRLTFHKQVNQLRCHYCGYSQTATILCRTCNGADFIHQGRGTQQIEEELAALFPGVEIIRFDLDATTGKHAHEEILSRFSRGEAQILLGTQLVTKGLDFPNVTVVGVINADTELAFPSYRSNERWFQMLAQVAGRAGRAHKPGNVYIQTRRAEEPIIKFASRHDFDGFAAHELQQRQLLWYPPFSRLLRIELKDKDAQKPMLAGERMAAVAAHLYPTVPILGPAPSSLLRRSDFFYWEILVKLPATSGTTQIEHFLEQVFANYETNLPPRLRSVSVIPTVDPLH